MLTLHRKLAESKSSSETLAVPPGVISGLTNEIIFEVVQHLCFIDSPAYITNNLPILVNSLAIEIYEIVVHHFKEEHQCQKPVSSMATQAETEVQYEFGDFEIDDFFLDLFDD